MADLCSDIALSEQLNQHRLTLAQRQLGTERAQLFAELPWLLHLNQAQLPGYHPDAPAGFAIEPLLPCPSAWQGQTPSHTDLLGLYSMGSTGSFGQSADSDLDCWLVHPSDLDLQAKQALRAKCDALERYFLQADLEVHLYLITPNLLESGQDGRLSNEHSGSAQQWFLLEEFYRSQTRLAGQPLAWWPNAPQQHPQLLSLGQLGHLPCAEFFGAALWQLFKGLDQPHKAGLKVLLLEAYMNEHPTEQILRDQLWVGLQQGRDLLLLDPYLMLFERVSQYLIAQDDQQRLSMAQRSFYLKCALPLSQPESLGDWRYPRLRDLISHWRWTRDQVRNLDQARRWHVGQLRWYNEQLDQLLLTSYQKITAFAAKQQQKSSLKFDERGILTRRLYTKFHRDAAKVPLLNPLWSKDLSETALTLLAVKDNPLHENGWYLYRQPPQGNRLFGEMPLYHASSRLACLAWALSNGLIGEQTQVYCYQNTRYWCSRKLTQLGQRLYTQFGSPEPVTMAALQAPWHYTKALVLCNVEIDPSAEWQGQPLMLDLQLSTVFSIGAKRKNLVGSLTLLTENSWGEHHCYRYEEEEGLLKLMAQLVAGLDRSRAPLEIPIFCTSKKLGRHIEAALAQLLSRVQQLYHQTSMERQQVWPLTLATKEYGLFIDPRGLTWQQLNDGQVWVQQLRQQGMVELPQPLLGEDPYSSAPAILNRYARRGLVQVFVRERHTGLDIYLLDENNVLQQLKSGKHNLSQMIEDLSTLHRLQDQHTEIRGYFNLPQFYWLHRDGNGELTVEPLID